MVTNALVAGAAVLFVAIILFVNTLIRAKVRVRHAWAQVDTQLQRRHDLIPNLVAAVRGSAGHERAALDAVTTARTAALATSSPTARVAAEDTLTEAIGHLLAVAEAYPQLQSDASFRALQQELADTEDRVAFSRGFANDRVARYRELTQTVPGRWFVRPLRLPQEGMFALDDERVRRRPDVRLEG